jgi:hypothetical protein
MQPEKPTAQTVHLVLPRQKLTLKTKRAVLPQHP